MPVACSTGTCYKSTRKCPLAEHYRTPQSVAASESTDKWPTGGQKTSKPQGGMEEKQDGMDRVGGEAQAVGREPARNTREQGYIQKAQHNMYLTCLMGVG